MAETKAMPDDFPQRWVVMGVSGCGKSTVGQLLATRMGFDYVEGDDYHPAANIEKMAAGIPLTDGDRHDWLLQLQQRIRQSQQQGTSLVLTCSALKRRYRDLLREADPELAFLHLHGDRSVIAARMQARTRHFMPLTLLDSQLRDLEPLQDDERGLQVDIQESPQTLVERVVQHFQRK